MANCNYGLEAKISNSLPLVQIILNKIPCLALLDSGSVFSLISAEFALKNEIKFETYQLFCQSVDQTLVSVIGKARLRIKLHKFSWDFQFLIVQNLAVEVILGVDFLTKSRISLDLGQKVLHFGFDPRTQVPFHFESCNSRYEMLGATSDPLFVVEPSTEIKLDHLSPGMKRDIVGIVEQFPDVLTNQLGLTDIIEYDIVLNDPTPVRLPPYRLAPPRMQVLKEKIEDMLEQGIIKPSKSHYSSPIFLVPKPGNDYRPVVDYRVLNSRIAIESVPLPDVHNNFHWFNRAKFFTSLDLNSAYHQIPLTQRSMQLTAFNTDWNLFEYTRVPFGIAVGAQVLTRLLDSIFSDIKFKYVFHYLDDLIIYSETYQEHLRHIREVFDRLRAAKLTVKPAKVNFLAEKLSFLGHLISSQGVTIDPDRTQKIRDYPVPKNAKGVARFVGMVNYFAKFIPACADLCAPLNHLRKKAVKFKWGDEQQQAFEKLKEKISNPPVLAMADFSRPFVLQTDACGRALAAVLLQEFPEGRRPIAFASRTLTQQERKLSMYELEALAVLFGIEKYRMYLEHVEFLLETDNQALSWVLGRPRKTGKIARWALRISAFRFKVSHIRSSANVVADTLSRMFGDEEPPPPSGDFETEFDPALLGALLSDLPSSFTTIKQAQRQDPVLLDIIHNLERHQAVPPYALKDEVLMCKARRDAGMKIVTPQALIPLIFQYFHVSPIGGHLGLFKTLNKIRQRFIWKGMDKDIQASVKSCTVCMQSKPAQKTHYGFLASNVATKPMEKLFVDYVGKLPRSKKGNSYLLVCVDAFTKYVWLFPVREATTRATISCLSSICGSFGPPKVIVTDNATQFTAHAFHKFCFDRGITRVNTTPYYPNPSQAERVNRNIKSALIAYHSADHSEWDLNLEWLQYAFNTAIHESHKSTPFSLLLGFQPNCPLSNLWSLNELLPDVVDPVEIKERWKRAYANLKKSHGVVERKYNRSRVPSPFKVGDVVFLKNHPLSNAANKFSAKLALRFLGPFWIHKFSSPVSVVLRDGKGKFSRAHVSQLKPQ